MRKRRRRPSPSVSLIAGEIITTVDFYDHYHVKSQLESEILNIIAIPKTIISPS